MEEEIEDFYWKVIHTLSEALQQQKDTGKYDVDSVQNVVDELDLECDRRIVYDEPTEEITDLKAVLEDFVDEGVD